MSNKRLIELDILRALAFIFVVIQHTMSGFSKISKMTPFDYYSMNSFFVLGKPAVPIFLFICGVSLFYTYSDSISLKDYYIKRFKFIFVPYLAWSAINMVALGTPEKLNNFFMETIAGNGSVHLWYMGMITRLYLIFPILLVVGKKIHSISKGFRLALFISVFPIYYLILTNLGHIAKWTGKALFTNPTYLQQRIVDISIVFWCLFFILGAYAALNLSTFKALVARFRVQILVFYAFLFFYSCMMEINIVNYSPAVQIFYYVFAILAYYIISSTILSTQKLRICLSFISEHSYAAYMVHYIILYGCAIIIAAASAISKSIRTGRTFLEIMKEHITAFSQPDAAWNAIFMPGQSHFLLFLSVTFFTIVVSTLTVTGLKQLPFSEYLTGIRSRENKLRIVRPSSLEA